MKAITSLSSALLLTLSLAAAVFCDGCASTESSKQASTEPEKKDSAPMPSEVKLKKDKDLQGVWLKPGFNFAGHPALSIEATMFKAVERPNEAAMRAFAVKELREQIARAAREAGLFSSVSADENSSPAPANAPALRLVNTIVEYEKGGGAGRYFAGLYGGGQPVVKVRGEMFDSGNNLVFVYEAKRSGEKAASRLVGVFRSDEEIQREDIRDLAIDLGDFMMRAAGLQPPKR